MRKIVMTENDFEKIDMLLASTSKKPRQPEIVNELKVKLLSAIVLPQKSVSKRVITMNSHVQLNELGSNRKIELTLSYPNDVSDREQKFSIFSEVGVALLGKSLGDIVNISIPGSIGHFQITDVIYQPEAAGDLIS